MTVTSSAAQVTTLDAAARHQLYRQMVLIRTFEEAMLRDYHADKVTGLRHRRRADPRRDAPRRRARSRLRPASAPT